MIKGHDGTWYLAIRTRKLTRAEEFIVFLSGEKGSKIAAEVTEKDLLDTTGKGRLAYKEIIFGCVGGVFHAADGVRSARVTECIADEKGDATAELCFVHWCSAADNEDDAGVQSSGTADQFFARFLPVRLGSAAAGGDGAGGGGSGDIGAGTVGEVALKEYPGAQEQPFRVAPGRLRLAGARHRRRRSREVEHGADLTSARHRR